MSIFKNPGNCHGPYLLWAKCFFHDLRGVFKCMLLYSYIKQNWIRSGYKNSRHIIINIIVVHFTFKCIIFLNIKAYVRSRRSLPYRSTALCYLCICKWQVSRNGWIKWGKGGSTLWPYRIWVGFALFWRSAQMFRFPFKEIE